MSGLSAAEQTKINLSVGAVMVSNYLSFLTMGIMLSIIYHCLSPAWTYFSTFPNDKWWFKALVTLCVSMCICDTIATGIWTYDWAVANYANPAVLPLTHWSFAAEAVLMATCGLSVQLFYAWRLWIMSMRKNWILSVVIGCLSILGWCVMCWQAHITVTHKFFSDLIVVLPVAWIWLGVPGADVLITISMIYYLDLRFRNEFQQAQVSYHAPRRFRRLIVRTVECNLLSLFSQVIAIGLFNHSSVGLYYLSTDMMLAKVYTFSLLVSLNCRHSDNGSESDTSDGGFSLSRRIGDIVNLTALHTTGSSFPNTQVSHIQRETPGDFQEHTKGPAFNDNGFDSHVMLSPV
ncbi:hypothetical protein BT96DRAFT_1005694 [Gymnopus androsaceus JB14]|uniref:DUF6534 domain-containing protein n=1 Tax=Gymnopus androsaceus JB14 TaxID=1447944 RepID=A0A6A4GN18_9AGAR|nr:hypothetical protein BT96DRAFT_1005694 [Gymnopus androsaceus JB14]